MAQPLNVKVTFTVPIDRDAWATEYGAGTTAAIRADVKAYIETAVLGQLASVGVLAEEA